MGKKSRKRQKQRQKKTAPMKDYTPEQESTDMESYFFEKHGDE